MGKYLQIPDNNMKILQFHISEYSVLKKYYTIQYGDNIYIREIFNEVDIKWVILITGDKKFKEIHNKFYVNDLNSAFKISLKNYIREKKLEKLLN